MLHRQGVVDHGSRRGSSRSRGWRDWLTRQFRLLGLMGQTTMGAVTAIGAVTVQVNCSQDQRADEQETEAR